MDFLFSILKRWRIVLATRLEQAKSGYYDVRGVVWCVKLVLAWWCGKQKSSPANVNILLQLKEQNCCGNSEETDISLGVYNQHFIRVAKVSRTFNLKTITSQLSADCAAPSRVT